MTTVDNRACWGNQALHDSSENIFGGETRTCPLEGTIASDDDSLNAIDNNLADCVIREKLLKWT